MSHLFIAYCNRRVTHAIRYVCWPLAMPVLALDSGLFSSEGHLGPFPWIPFFVLIWFMEDRVYSDRQRSKASLVHITMTKACMLSQSVAAEINCKTRMTRVNYDDVFMIRTIHCWHIAGRAAVRKNWRTTTMRHGSLASRSVTLDQPFVSQPLRSCWRWKSTRKCSCCHTGGLTIRLELSSCSF